MLDCWYYLRFSPCPPYDLANLFGGHEYLIIGIVQSIKLAHPTIFTLADKPLSPMPQSQDKHHSDRDYHSYALLFRHQLIQLVRQHY